MALKSANCTVKPPTLDLDSEWKQGSCCYHFGGGERKQTPKKTKKKKKKRESSMALRSSKLPNISDDLQMIIDANMDEVHARRQAREAFKDIQLSIDHCLFKVPIQGLTMEESYTKNSRGLEIFSKTWLPESSTAKALICYCHGYGDTCTFFFEGIARKLASAGYGVCAMDYPGFGLSEGLHCYIPSFDRLVDDVIEHYSNVKEKPEFRGLPSFLFGQSMGGAVALKVHLKQPKAWNGAVLVAPMCKIADEMYPSFILTQLLIALAKVMPQLKLVPERDLADMAFRRNKELTAYNVIAYKDKARLGTAVELLHTTDEIADRLEEVCKSYYLAAYYVLHHFTVDSIETLGMQILLPTIYGNNLSTITWRLVGYKSDYNVCLPLLILHGEADVVTDPSVSKALYEKASSEDKKLILYKDAYHSLLEGEPDDVIFRVFDDIISWLDDHSSKQGMHS